jgi:O-antigen ligase
MLEAIALGGLYLSAFLMGFSLPAARAALALSALFVLIRWARERRPPAFPPSAWLGLAFLLLTCAVTVFGVNPELGVPKLRKLVWFAGLPLAATLLVSGERIRTALIAYAAGVGVLAAWVLIANPLCAAEAVRAGRFERFADALIDAGSMTNGQRLMLGMTISFGFLLAAWRDRRAGWAWALLFGLQAAAMVMNFKRGSWFCALLVMGVLVLLQTNWRVTLAAAMAALALLAVPAVRLRLADLRTEFQANKGGRMLMWRVIAPELIRQHPWGVGYRSLTNRMMRQIDRRVEPGRDHLHSNPLQILVESGWAGLGLWLLWMGRGAADAVAYARDARRRRPAERTVAIVLALTLAGLLANGLVEYNMGDAELVLPYGLILGAAAAARARAADPLPAVRRSSGESRSPAR